MKLTDMKRPRSKTKSDSPVMVDDTPYPWGLRLNLRGPEIDKLKMDLSKIRAGESISIVADAEIVSIMQAADSASESKEVGLQITKMALSGDNKKSVNKFKNYQDVQNSQPG